MDSDTLNTASTYLNNLLLARGLLRNGKSLDFAKPTRDTRAQIINLVHDLLLRRDRDQENREHVALSLQKLRADSARKDSELEKLQIRLNEKERNLVQAQTDTRNAKAEMRKMDASTKALQDQLAKLKTSVNHIKTQCTNDVRKRDMHIERLKTHLQGQQRGNKGGVVAPMIHISGSNGSNVRSMQSFNASVREIDDPAYSLKQESTEFLTQLGQSLSDENDGLISMLRGILRTLKDLLGLEQDSADHDRLLEMNEDESMSMDMDNDQSPISYEDLAADVDSTLEILRTVLTSADFVSMEEVEQRDEEIIRLREGWVMMEARWKEVLVMMNTWRTKMDSGDTINLDDLKRGLGLGEGLSDGLSSPSKPVSTSHGKITRAHDSPSRKTDHNRVGGDDETRQSQPSTASSRNSVLKAPSTALDPPEVFHQRPVKERHLRRMSPNVQSPRKVAFADNDEDMKERGFDATPFKEYAQSLSKPISERALRSQRSAPDMREAQNTARTQRNHIDLFSDPDLEFGEGPCLTPDDEEADDHLTVKEKLRAAQSEAEQAALRMHIEPQDKFESSKLSLGSTEEISTLRSPAKKSKIKGRARRRKSTLSPEELENLMLGNGGLDS